MSSSSSSSYVKLQKKYDVFINFYGDDIRYNFLTHLFKALTRKQINAFKDENLERGEEISRELLNRIKESHISIVIFSENYPYSTWCLDELAQIFECHKKEKQIVIPVFRHVDPSLVQELKGKFKDALIKHGKEFQDEVEEWSHALKEISGISGFVLSPTEPEDELIEKITNDVDEKLSCLQSNNPQHRCFFGINSRVKMVESLLCIKLIDHVRIVGIWGMGGIGKTTIADKVFNKIKNNFDAFCFVTNVREKLEKCAPNDLRDNVFRKLLGDEKLFIGTPYSLEPSIKRRLKCVKVLIVFDDVIDSNQLMLVLGDSGSYSPGSRIIVTSRDSQVLKNVGANKYIYHVEGLNDSEALTLFSWHAFHQNHPKKKYVKLSKEAIKYAGGVPLALIVLGSNLYDRTIEAWEEELEKVKNIPDKDILKFLKISYDGLERNDKAIFLDIACFFKGKVLYIVIKQLKSFRFSTRRGINRLLEKSLITLDDDYIEMHDLLEQMGKNIVIEESNNMLGRQSRLWKSQDIIHVLRNNLGTAKVEVIYLHMEEIDEKVEIGSRAFMKMSNLRFLKISFDKSYSEGVETKVFLPNGLEFLPGSLRYLRWDKYPWSYLPSNFCLKNLVELQMPFSQLNELWNVEKSPKNLEFIDLGYSTNLVKTPDFSNCLNLKNLKLEGCSSLVEIFWSNEAGSSLYTLNLSGTAVKQLPEKLGNLKELETLYCSGCKGLKLPTLDGLINLRSIILSDCEMPEFPNSLCSLTSLEVINLSRNNFKGIPVSINELSRLQSLHLGDCNELESLPELPPTLQFLDLANCTSLKSNAKSINQLKELRILRLSGCEGLTLPPLNGLINLYEINLSNCHMSEFPEDLCSLTSLKEIDLSGNNFKSIPASINELSRLWRLELGDCKELESLPESISTAVLPQLLVLRDCIKLKQESWSAIVNDVLEQHLSGNKLRDEYSYCLLCIAGSEVPQSMMYKSNDGSSLSVTLDFHDLIGFSLCVFVASNADLARIECSVILPDNEDKRFILACFDYPLTLESQWENMFLWYSHNNVGNTVKSEASFEFKAVGFNDEEVPIIKCGFTPIFNEGKKTKKRRADKGPNLKYRKRKKHENNEGLTSLFKSLSLL